jgi:hypothetical protein
VRLASLLVSAALAAGGFLVLPASTASAACADAGEVYYKISNVSKSRQSTNLRSDYLRGPGTISYSKNKTATVSATGTVTVGAEAGVIFAKASASASVSLGGSWSHGGTWSYTKSVPKGKTARLVMFHESRKFTVKKYQYDGRCNSIKKWERHVNAPVKKSVNVWDLQYK